jgi:RNA-directed DNA polymerase
MSADAESAGAAPASLTTWHAIHWRRVYRTVRRLQARIVKAVHEGRWNKVRALVYLLTHSFGGRALAVLRVTTNAGAQTPGVAGVLWDTPELKTTAVDALMSQDYQPQPLRRVYIPKSNGRQRPLGIPTLIDRAQQALYLLGLEPIAECTADANSYGFRRERCCADALQQVHNVLGGPHAPRWILEGDILSCFDRISHEWLWHQVPMDRDILRSWLKAGYLEKRVFQATTAGTPQGGILSPVLANLALDGLEALLQQQFAATPTQRRQHKVHLVRYADDFVITGTSQTLRRYEVMPLVAHFLSARGLELSHEKTRITHSEDGFDFLGQQTRRYADGRLRSRPCRKNIRALLAKLRTFFRDEGGHLTAATLIQQLNLRLRGWALYHRHAASTRTFAWVDRWLFRKVWRWCRKRHQRKAAAWLKEQYFTCAGERNWVFTGTVYNAKGEPSRVYLQEVAKIHITRHLKIQQDANPFDPQWALYFEQRRQQRMQQTLAGRRRTAFLWRLQEGRCRLCEQPLTEEAGWQVHHRVWRVFGGSDNAANLELVHPHCHRQYHATAYNRG